MSVRSYTQALYAFPTNGNKKNTHSIGLHVGPTSQFTETQTRWYNDIHCIYISIIPSTGSTGQPLCWMFCTATVTNHSWGAGSSGANESYPHMICHYITANKAYYWLKWTQLCVSEEAEETEGGDGGGGGHSLLVYQLLSYYQWKETKARRYIIYCSDINK